MINHKCIKPGCDNSYEDNDIDAYYCPSCIEMNKKIAEEINKKVRPSKTVIKSDYQRYNEIQQARGVRFVNISDLGIKL